MTKYSLICCLLFFALLIAFNNCMGQAEKKDLRFGFKINPLSLLVGSISISGEYFLQKQNSVQVGLQCFMGFVPLTPSDSYDARVASFRGSYRHYLNKDIRKSAYLEPFMRYNFSWNTTEGENTHSVSLGFAIGKQWIKKTNKSFEIFAGPYYSIPIGSEKEKEPSFINGFWVRAGITIGGFNY